MRDDKRLTIDSTKIKKAIQAKIPLSVTTYTLPHEMEVYMGDILTAFLSELNQSHMTEFLTYSLNELIKAEQFATEYAVMKSGHMCNTITLPEVNAFTIGQLLYFFEMQTAFAGELLGIDAFDQPGVEEGKNATYALLGKAGYDVKKAELDARPAANAQYII